MDNEAHAGATVMADGKPTWDWPRLAEYAKARREELGLTQRDAAYLAGLSTNGYRSIEEAQNVRPSTLTACENALSWAPGSARRILAGGEPEALPAAGASLAGRSHGEGALSTHSDTASLPIALRAELARGEIAEVRTLELSDDLHVLVLGVVKRDVADDKLLALLSELRDWFSHQPH